MKHSASLVPLRIVIVEELAAVLDVRRGEVEVYKNPSPREFDVLMRPLPEDDDASIDLMSWRNTRFDGSRSPVQEVRAVLVGNDLYAWNYEAALHAVAMREIGKELAISTSEMVPVYLDISLRDRSLAVRFGAGGSNRKVSNAALFKLAKTHPAFRGWKVAKAVDDPDD